MIHNFNMWCNRKGEVTLTNLLTKYRPCEALVEAYLPLNPLHFMDKQNKYLFSGNQGKINQFVYISSR